MTDQSHTPNRAPNQAPAPTQQPQQPQPQQAAHAPAQQPAPQPAPNPPVDTLRDRNLKASIWERKGDDGSFYSTSLARTYQDKDGALRDTNSFSGPDLLRVSELAKSAYHRTNELQREKALAREQQQAEVAERKAEHRSSRERGTRRPRTRNRDR